MDWSSARDQVIAHALESGWAEAGVSSLAPYHRARARALGAIGEGRMEGMPWFSPERVEEASDLGGRYPWAKSVLSLAWAYRPAAPLTPASKPPAAEAGRPRGRFAAYACIDDGAATVDYHDLLGEACDELAAWIAGQYSGARTKRFIDHGWAMDRPIAERAGIGFAGKNTTLITQAAGSYVLLAEILTSLPLPPTPVSRRSCGRCQACLPACPTGALLAPGVMDAPRCISYLTIEHRGPIPEAMRPLIGTWAFGCDLCMEACPINHRLAPSALSDAGASTVGGPVPFPDLVECLELDDAGFEARFRGTAVWRTGRAGLARNAAIALGNAGDRAALPALRQALVNDPDEVVREAAAWAFERLGSAPFDQPPQLLEVVPAEQV
jgi:epoxyqueuosine reductase